MAGVTKEAQVGGQGHLYVNADLVVSSKVQMSWISGQLVIELLVMSFEPNNMLQFCFSFRFRSAIGGDLMHGETICSHFDEQGLLFTVTQAASRII